MNGDQVAMLRALLAPTGWLDSTSTFARALRRSARVRNGLLVVGTQDDEPWHMTAHLADESRLARLPELAPTLVRWRPPPGAPPHLAVSLDRLRAASRDETLLVVTAQHAPAELLERVQDVRRSGTTVFALDTGDAELDRLAHESLAIPAGRAPLSFAAAQHLVSAAAADDGDAAGLRHAAEQLITSGLGDRQAARAVTGSGGARLRRRLARLLDAVSGSEPD